MLRRWIIRSLSLTLVLFVLTAWVASYWDTATLVHYTPMGPDGSGQNGFLVIRTGHISFLREGPLLSADWHAGLTSNTFTHWWVPQFLDYYFADAKYRFLGFYFDIGITQFVSLPLWFPTLLSAGLLWLIWRKTKPNPPGRAFPIDPAGQHPHPS